MEKLKKKILNELKALRKKELVVAKDAYERAHSMAIDPEMKSDGKYDTRAIEAGYLVDGQKRRLDQISAEVQMLEKLDINLTQDTISVGSLIKLKINESEEKFYFLSLQSGGGSIEIGGHKIYLISASSPIGEEVIGLEKGDRFELEKGGNVSEYEILMVN